MREPEDESPLTRIAREHVEEYRMLDYADRHWVDITFPVVGSCRHCGGTGFSVLLWKPCPNGCPLLD